MEKSVYSQICPDLSKFIIFECNDGLITPVGTTDESSYYMQDIMRDHVARDEIIDPKPEHVCSTLVARVLRQGLGVKNYAFFVDAVKQVLGHSYAYPELIFEVAKIAQGIEKNNASKYEDEPSPKLTPK